MNLWMEAIFPEYCPPRFDRLLAKLQYPDGQQQIQILVGLVDTLVVGLAQVFYQKWQGGLLADIDLLGVLKPFRRFGLATALVQETIHSALQMAKLYQMPAIGVLSLIDPNDDSIVRLHQKQRAQIRWDYPYPSGDVIVWYPIHSEYKDIPTSTLAEQLQLFGQLLRSS